MQPVVAAVPVSHQRVESTKVVPEEKVVTNDKTQERKNTIVSTLPESGPEKNNDLLSAVSQQEFETFFHEKLAPTSSVLIKNELTEPIVENSLMFGTVNDLSNVPASDVQLTNQESKSETSVLSNPAPPLEMHSIKKQHEQYQSPKSPFIGQQVSIDSNMYPIQDLPPVTPKTPKKKRTHFVVEKEQTISSGVNRSPHKYKPIDTKTTNLESTWNIGGDDPLGDYMMGLGSNISEADSFVEAFPDVAISVPRKTAKICLEDTDVFRGEQNKLLRAAKRQTESHGQKAVPSDSKLKVLCKKSHHDELKTNKALHHNNNKQRGRSDTVTALDNIVLSGLKKSPHRKEREYKQFLLDGRKAYNKQKDDGHLKSKTEIMGDEKRKNSRGKKKPAKVNLLKRVSTLPQIDGVILHLPDDHSKGIQSELGTSDIMSLVHDESISIQDDEMNGIASVEHLHQSQNTISHSSESMEGEFMPHTWQRDIVAELEKWKNERINKVLQPRSVSNISPKDVKEVFNKHLIKEKGYMPVSYTAEEEHLLNFLISTYSSIITENTADGTAASEVTLDGKNDRSMCVSDNQEREGLSYVLTEDSEKYTGRQSLQHNASFVSRKQNMRSLDQNEYRDWAVAAVVKENVPPHLFHRQKRAAVLCGIEAA